MLDRPDTPPRETEWYRKLHIEVLDQEIKKDIARQLRGNTAKRTGTFLWITINPKPCTVDVFLSHLKKITEKRWISSRPYLYVIEQRKERSWYVGDNPDYINNGKHCHMIVEAKKAKSHALREIHNSMKPLCTKESIDIKVCPMDYLDDKKNYCLGTKTGDGKDVKQEGDKIFRLKKNLSAYYISDGCEVRE